MALSVVILAAGKGTRMKSSLPKVLHTLADRPLVEHVIDSAQALNPSKVVVVYGHGGEAVPQALSGHSNLSFVCQQEQLGTGHAVAQALPLIDDNDQVLVLYGDVPLTPIDVLQKLTDSQPDEGISVLTVMADDPTGYGRIIRDQKNQVRAIVEQKDASPEQQLINEVNSGIVIAKAASFNRWLSQIDTNNAQGELYLTDCIGLADKDGVEVVGHLASHEWQVAGVNNRKQLADLERVYQRLLTDDLMDQGVSFYDPARVDIRGELSAGQDCSIDINCVFSGTVALGNNVSIGPNCVICNTVIGDNVVIKANSVIEDAKVGTDSTVGPFARLRPGAELKGDSHIGNFVEVKKATIGVGSKVNHLSYVGDASVGDKVNIGAGTITCNYDGANKYQTIIEDNVFVGSDSQLVAPVTIKQGATIGAGSTITADVNEGVLVLSRTKQREISGWKRPVKKKK
ncbi:MAG: UDP-N-acetylglucosamine diphosphorylase/glucosamine-1-phosphate N-acetyltransferase [Kangiellaceae bacterium]|nr:UDP-N-acetylglucosamine diphosphorylase/glucosamine-1-phosphate N-acetyltransferase [Kangiellaceae bacterium]|tara:strand:+ start:5428 stop:6798 length:1371 start_codon:yes stop_codon:yes gene_type:complete